VVPLGATEPLPTTFVVKLNEGSCVKFAVTVVSVIILSVLGLAFPVRPPPDQPLNSQPASAVALKVAFVPERYRVPLGGVTEPLPFLLIVRVYEMGGGGACIAEALELNNFAGSYAEEALAVDANTAADTNRIAPRKSASLLE